MVQAGTEQRRANRTEKRRVEWVMVYDTGYYTRLPYRWIKGWERRLAFAVMTALGGSGGGGALVGGAGGQAVVIGLERG